MIRRPPNPPLFPSTPLFRSLTASAAMVITDSGGVQEETTYLGIPCLTVRPNTERPVTLRGTNRLVDARRDAIIRSANDRSEEHTSELQSQSNIVCRLLLEKK